jgi:hypothetical protein
VVSRTAFFASAILTLAMVMAGLALLLQARDAPSPVRVRDLTIEWDPPQDTVAFHHVTVEGAGTTAVHRVVTPGTRLTVRVTPGEYRVTVRACLTESNCSDPATVVHDLREMPQ